MKKICAVLFLMAISFNTLSDINETQVVELREMILKSPELALLETSKLWKGEAGLDNFETGLIHIRALISNKKWQAAEQLIKNFNTLESLSSEQKSLILAMELHVVRQSDIAGDFELIAKRVKSKLNELEQITGAAEDRAKLALNSELATNYYFKQEFDNAEDHYLKAIKYFEPLSPVLKSDLLNRLGVVYALQSRLVEAGEYMLKSINMLEQNDLPVNSISLQNLGGLYYQLKEYKKTIEYSELALEAQVKPNARTSSLYSNIAAAYVELNQQELAVEKLYKAIEISEELGVTASNARNNLGYIFHQMGRFEEALEQLNLSAADLNLEENHDIIGVSFKSRGDVYASMKDFDKAIELYEQAYQTFKLHDYKIKRVELYPKMIEVLEIKGDFQRAYQMMVEYKALNDELTDVESNKQADEVMTAFEVEKNKQALADSELVRAQQQKNIDLLNSKNELQSSTRNLMFIMVSALILLLLFIFRSWHFRGKVNKVLTEKNKRIEFQQNELVELNTQLKGQAEVDSLTGINNRRYITNKLAKIITEPKLANKKWCLIIIDIDNFKTVNDIYGHQRGDEVLQQFAECLDWVRNPEDVIARWGGEEFLWLVECKSSEDGPNSCDAFQAALADLSWFRGNEDTVTCSLGFTSFPLVEKSFEDWEAALRLADYALYQAKKSGKKSWTGIEIVDPNFDHADIKDIEGLIEGKNLRVLKKQA